MIDDKEMLSDMRIVDVLLSFSLLPAPLCFGRVYLFWKDFVLICFLRPMSEPNASDSNATKNASLAQRGAQHDKTNRATTTTTIDVDVGGQRSQRSGKVVVLIVDCLS